MFNTEGSTVRSLLDFGAQMKTGISMTFFIVWFLLSCITYGTAIPAGLFIPGILIGCSIGHFVRRVVELLGVYHDTEA